MKKHPFMSACLIAALLGGCSMIPNYERPETDVPSVWKEQEASKETVIAKDWWKNFNSAELDGLMTQALSYNNDLAAAIQRVEQARATSKSTRSSLFPMIDANGSVGYDRIRGENGDSQSRDSSENSGTAGIGVSYELDLFGQNRAEIAAAKSRFDSASFDKEAVALVVMSDVAKGYFNVLSLQERLDIANQNVESARDLLRIVEARYDAGAITLRDVAQQKTDLANVEANKASAELNLKIARTSLAVLLGIAPQSLVIKTKDLRSLTVPEIAAGQPSKLLERRPDILASEASLIAANADIGAAHSAFFPNITLGLDASITSASLGDPTSSILSLASGLTTPIFRGGLLQGNLDFTKARKAELIENYRKTILTSFKEVEDSLAGLKAAKSRETHFETAKNESQKAYDLAKQQYDLGSVDFQSVLDTRQVSLTSQDNYVQTKNERLAAAVDLYKALGGGWQSQE